MKTFYENCSNKTQYKDYHRKTFGLIPFNYFIYVSNEDILPVKTSSLVNIYQVIKTL